jgi:hypothetical protein
MNMKKLFDKAFSTMKSRGWERIYILIDVHDVIMKSNYNGASGEVLEHAIVPLKAMSDDPRFCLIMWTCSGPEHIQRYRDIFKQYGIEFDYANENPEVTNTNGYGDYTKKLYANIVLDDKAGFDHEKDWCEISRWLCDNDIMDAITFSCYFHNVTLLEVHN